MPIDAWIPYEALKGLQRAEPYDPMAFQARLQRVQQAQGPNAAMLRLGQEQQENQEIAAIAQQYGDDYDEMGKAIIARFPHRADVVGGIQTALKDGAAKHLAMTVEARSKLQSRLAELQGADATTWEPVTQDIVKEFPQLSPLFAGRPYSPELQQQIVGIGQSQDQWLDAQSKAAQSLLDGKKQEGAARLIVAADTPPKQQELKGLLAQAGWTKFLGVMPDAASAQAYLDKQAKADPTGDKAKDLIANTTGGLTGPVGARVAKYMKAHGLTDVTQVPDGILSEMQKESAQSTHITVAGGSEKKRGVTAGDTNKIAEDNTALSDLDILEKTIGPGATGIAAQAGAALPNWATNLTGWGTGAKSRQATIDLVKQVIGKSLEGGVLRKEDEIKYAKILPTIGDAEGVVRTKIAGLRTAIQQKREEHFSALEDAGYDVSKFRARQDAAKPKTGPGPKADPLGIR